MLNLKWIEHINTYTDNKNKKTRLHLLITKNYFKQKPN